MTQEEIGNIISKCSDVENGTAFASFFELCYAPHPSKGKVNMKEESYEWQRQAAVTLLKHKRIISKKSRQVGFSTLLQAYALWRALFFPAQQITIVSIGQQESIEFLEKLEFIYENLPVWLKSPKKEDSKTKIKFKNGSVIKSLANTPKAGRSSSISLLILDEFSEYGKNAKKIMSSASPALGPGFKKAFNNYGLPSQLIICSTVPEVLENNEYMRIYRESVQQGNASQYKIIQPTVHDNEFYADPEWHEMMKTDLGLHAYNREVLGVEITSLENSFIPEDILTDLNYLHPIRMDFLKPDDVDEEGYAKNEYAFAESEKDNFDEELNYIKGLWIWHDPVPGKEYGIASDVSTGRNTDTSTFHIFDLETLEQCAEFQGKPNTEQFKRIIRIVANYYNDAKVSVERNSMGEGICQWFAYGDESAKVTPYDNFYFERARGKKLIPGHYTSVGNRSNMLALMLNFLIKPKNLPRPLTINSQRTISELKSFGWSKTGKLQGISNTDDLVMALAQFCYLRELFFLSTKQGIANGLFATPEDEISKQEDEIRKKHFAFQETGIDKELEQFEKMGYHVGKKIQREVSVFDDDFDFREL